MRFLAFLVLVVLVEALAIGQSFNRRYDMQGEGRPQTAWGIERAIDGDWVVISASTELDSISPDTVLSYSAIYLTKIDQIGDTLQHSRHFLPGYGLYPGWANCCATVPSGGYVVGGSRHPFGGDSEAFLMRFDNQGDTLWTRSFGGTSEYWIGRQVKCTADDGFLIVGSTDSIGNGNGFALKTDSVGNEQWRRVYTWPQTYSTGIVSVTLAADSDVFMGGSRFLSVENGDRWVQRTDADGQIVWRVSWGGSWSEGATQIVTLSDGHVLVYSGKGYAVDAAAMRPYIAKLDSTDGSVIWENEYGPVIYSTLFFAGKECDNGDLIACGVSYTGGQQGLLLRTTAEGDSLWMRRYFYQDTLITTGQGRFYDVLPTEDEGFIAAGAVYNPVGGPHPPGYSQDTWVVKVDGAGCIIPGCDGVGITEQATNLLDAITLYPNPASGQVTVQLDLPAHLAGVPLQVTLVDASGRFVHQETIANGMGSFTLSLASVSAGMYSVHVSHGTTWLTGAKLVVE